MCLSVNCVGFLNDLLETNSNMSKTMFFCGMNKLDFVNERQFML